MTAESLNTKLIAQLKQNNLIKRSEIEQAFLDTPRHLFLPQSSLADAYQDRAIPTKLQDDMAISSCSQPAIIAIMLEQLEVQRGMNVLEIGAGTGYNAALLSRLVGDSGHVTTIDIDEDIVQQAREHLRAAGISQVSVLCQDGGLGFAGSAPYDRIILTVGAWDISRAWFDQLKTGGLLVLPLWIGARQYAIAFVKVEGHLRSRAMQPCGFMALRGNFAGPSVCARAGEFIIGGENVEQLDAARLGRLLERQPQARQLTSTDLSLGDFLDHLAAQRELVFSVVPDQSAHDFVFAYGLCTATLDSAALLLAKDLVACEPTTQVLLYGSESAWNLLRDRVRRFTEAGRPSLLRGVIEAYPLGHAPASQFLLRKRWMEYALTLAYVV